MKRNLALLLSLLMLTGLIGCASAEDPIVGTWVTVIDMTDTMNETIAGQAAAPFIEFRDLSVSMNATFHEDGTYSMEVDPESVSVLEDAYQDQIKDGMMDYLEDEMSKMWNGMTLDTYLALSGMTREEAMDMITDGAFGSGSAVENLDRLYAEGNYKTENGRISMSNSLDEPASATSYAEYTLEGDSLTIIENGISVVFERVN